MAHEVDKVVICDAFEEPDRHYELLPGGRSRLREGRRPSRTYRSTAADARRGLRAILSGQDQPAFDFAAEADHEDNAFINDLRSEVRAWREEGYPRTARVTRALLEWWFERDPERMKETNRLFFCQQEALETLIFLYEAKKAPRMPETDFLRYALKLATGTGKTVVMAGIVVWSTLHRAKVSGSSLTRNFLVLVPNVTVRSRVSGVPRGDGLQPTGDQDLYVAFDLVPPAYVDDFRPNVMVRNWQSIRLDASRDDWAEPGTAAADQFVPYAVLRAMKRRERADPKNAIRRVIGGRADVLVINDEAHHVYGEKRTRAGEEPAFIRWSKIIDLLRSAVRVPLVVDLSATPWYGSGSPKAEGTLFEWVVSDFSVYDAFESGLVKVVRLPEPDGPGRDLIDLWDRVKGAKTKEDYLSACKGAVETIYSSWATAFDDWSGRFVFDRGLQPVLLVVADSSRSANWLHDRLTRDFPRLRNPTDGPPVTLRIDSKVFESDAGKMKELREMVDTVGKSGASGEHVRAIVSVNMLSEGWDVKSVTHILGLRAFGSPLLTEQIVGRGLRRSDYSLLYQPLDAREGWAQETVDAFGVPFVGFPVQRRKRKRKDQPDRPAERIEFPETRREEFRIRIPNVRSWGVALSDRRLIDLVELGDLPDLVIDGRETPPAVPVKPVVGGNPEAVLTLERFREENPLTATAFRLASELLERTSPEGPGELKTGPSFDELLEVSRAYLDGKVRTLRGAEPEDVGIYLHRTRALDILENAVRAVGVAATREVPLLGSPKHHDTASLKPFSWYGEVVRGARKTCSNKVPCDRGLEVRFAEFLESARDVETYVKNERLRFSIRYFEHHRPRRYFPDFVVRLRSRRGPTYWVVETKGEVFADTHLKRAAARRWCDRLSASGHGTWRYLFVQQVAFERALAAGASTFAALREALVNPPKRARLDPVDLDESSPQAFTSHLPLYSLAARAGVFSGDATVVEPVGWLPAHDVGRLDRRMFVARAVGRSMEPRVYDGDYCVFRSGGRIGAGRTVLAQWAGAEDPETGGRYAIKIHRPVMGPGPDGRPVVVAVELAPLNPDCEAMTFEPDDDLRLIATLVGVLRPK